MIKNYIFDFGNVLVRFDPDELTAVSVPDPETRKMVRDVLFDRLYWDRLDAGTITDEELKRLACQRLPEYLHECACQAFDQWTQLHTPIEGMPELVEELKARGGKLYLLSNISIGFANNYHRNPWASKLFSLFDGLVFSGPIGITKPNREIFEYLLNRYQLDPSECLFIDDSPKNIIGCENIGIKGYLFDGNAEKLREALGLNNDRFGCE